MKRQSNFFNMQALTSCISMMMVLVLLGAVVFFVLTARNLSNQVRENISITLLLGDDITPSEVQQMKATLQGKRYIKKLTFNSKEQALREMSKEMGANPADFLGHNPFTASYEVGLKADYANEDSIRWIAKELKATPKVMDMVYQHEWVETINDLIQKVSLILLVLAGLLTFVSFALINNTLRLSVYSKRFLIQTMKCVGASWAFIRRPFLWKSMLLGLVAAVVADGLLYAGMYALLMYEPAMSEVVTLQIQVVVGASVLLFGLLITLFCAYVSVNRFLRMKTADMYTA